MVDLNQIYRELKASAKSLKTPYEEIPINTLADKFCEATDTNNTRMREVYFSALLLRFWYKIYKTFSENPSLKLELTDYFDWLVGSILQACAPDARAWQQNEKLSAQQIINQIFATRYVAQAYYESNLLKNQGKLATVSLDDELDDESGLTVGDQVADTDASSEYDEASQRVKDLIQEYIDKNKLVEAIIFDTLAFKDCYKHDKQITRTVDTEGNKQTYTTYTSTFWPYKLVKELRELTADYTSYFISEYHVSRKAFEAAFTMLAKANSQKKYKLVEKALSDLKTYIAAGSY